MHPKTQYVGFTAKPTNSSKLLAAAKKIFSNAFEQK